MSQLDTAIFIFSCVLGYVSLCRLNKSKIDRSRVSFQIRYLLVFVGSFCSAFTHFLFPAQPLTGYLILVVCMVVSQIATSRDWLHGAPAYTLKKE